MALPRGAMGLLRFVIVPFPDHTHILILGDLLLWACYLDSFQRYMYSCLEHTDVVNMETPLS